MNAEILASLLMKIYPSAPLERDIFFKLLRKICSTSSVSVNDLVREEGYSKKKITEILDRIHFLEMEGSDTIIGVAGISLRETPYSMDCERIRVYARGALDAIIAPTLLLSQVGVNFEEAGSGLLFNFRFGFDQAFSLNHEEAVIGFPSKDSFITDFIQRPLEFKLFSHKGAASQWLGINSDGFLISVKNVFVAAVQLRRSLRDSYSNMLCSER